ncbi:hypothetical protein [Streptomyces sp. NPDC088360]|uniref:hypothetical protein n=1 Tax=Streptomyces sp. NPDC088360 TaxID=3154515 RepID=UPI00344DDA80
MSRKHYRAIADVLKHAHETHPEAHEALDHVTRELAGICAQDNHHFRRQQFYDAATPEPTE